MKSAKGPFVITRVFNAPREKVFRAWTEASELQKWFGPKGFTMPVCKLDLRPGGVMHFCLRGPDGSDMWGKWIWKEIVAPRKLVTLTGFSDPAGGWTRHPMAPVWPLETLSTTTFEDEGGKTRMTLESTPYEASAEERAIFDTMHDSMKGGWTGTMEQLEAYLAGN
ncbi:MAG: SRPBCC domain-containing protein [Planctomycetes bacterium]|nr:SRPBCC domain-containing protein [Planctomycetota bacterium]